MYALDIKAMLNTTRKFMTTNNDIITDTVCSINYPMSEDMQQYNIYELFKVAIDVIIHCMSYHHYVCIACCIRM